MTFICLTGTFGGAKDCVINNCAGATGIKCDSVGQVGTSNFPTLVIEKRQKDG